MKTKIVFAGILFILFQGYASAQNYFSAVVKDSITNETLIGATVVENGKQTGGSTDLNGNVKFLITDTGNLKFSVQFLGYTKKIIQVRIPQKQSILEILLAPENEGLEEVTVSAVRTNSHIEDIPTRIEVLGMDDLGEENGVKPGNILSLLGDIAGIQMQQVSASTGNTYARIQGLNGRYTQLLKDGMPLFGGMSGSFGIMQIPPLDLIQIEIIKGSCSTLFGGGAIGGIINLVSKDPTEKQDLSITVNQTSLLESNLNLYAAKRYKKIGYTFFAGQTYQKQRDVNKDSLSDLPFVFSTVIHPKLIFYFSPKSTVTLNYTGTFDQRTGGEMNYFTAPNKDTLYHVGNKINRHSSDVRWNYNFSKDSKLTLKLSSSYLTQEINTKSYTLKADQLIFYSELSYFHKRAKADYVAGVNFNGDLFNNTTASLSNLKDYGYQTVGIFLQNTWKPFTKLTIESGLRGDYHFKYGFFPLPRLSLMYKFNTAFSARVNGGLGYIIPTVANYVNPETDLNILSSGISLKPEHSQGVNADVNFQKILFRKLNVTINQSFFFTNISQPVYDSSFVASVVKLANASQPVQTKGLQTYMRLKYSTVELYLGYVYTQVQKLYDKVYPVPVVTPRHNISTVLFYEPVDSWRFGIESSYIAGQLSGNYSNTKNYFLMAAMIQWNVGKFSIVLNAENLLDFRQNKIERIYDGTVSNPVFHKLWAPIDGRVINLSVKWKL